ncbi:hypothetical protein ACQEVM_17325 [Streptomyces sp. CA-243310]|uniref:hypothetical protein n=1 Tax=Streptomyces sp. CA-243310 TaxID=3240056 RepID=UPI003D8F649F
MNILDGVIGKGLTGGTQVSPIKVIVCHTSASVSVSTSSTRPACGQPCSTGAPLTADQPQPYIQAISSLIVDEPF